MTQIHSLVPLWKIAVEVNRQIYQVLGGRTHNILHKVLQIDANTAKTFAGKRKNGGYVISLTKKFINATTDITNSFASYGL